MNNDYKMQKIPVLTKWCKTHTRLVLEASWLVMCACDIWDTLIFPFTTLPNISTVMAQQFITTTLSTILGW